MGMAEHSGDPPPALIPDSGVARASRSVPRTPPLLRYTVRRLLAALILTVFLSVGIFVAMAMLPGDVATTILGRNATPQQVALIEKEYHLNESLPNRYGQWVSGFFSGDLGTSFANHEPVSKLLRERGSNTLQFSLIAIAILIPLAIGLGVISALRVGGIVDHLVSGVSLLGISFPDFIVATLVAWVFGIVLGWFPPVALVAPGASPLETPDILVLPVLTMVVIGAPFTSRMVRASMIDVLASDYVQTARLHGIPERRIILRHALPNALAPTVQIIAATLLWLLGGVIAIEIVFNYPGIGSELVRSVQIRDINFVQSVALVLGAIFILINVVADLIVVLLVPRLRGSVG
jgi:peptide/nickel transport system permease protein